LDFHNCSPPKEERPCSQKYLNHATPRLFCACEVEPNARAQLLGFEESRAVEAPKLAAIAAAWRRRWLLNWVQNEEVLDRVGRLGPESVRAELWADQDGQFKLPLE
jgi:hypothetical protein